ncbi:MAG: RuBisCO large subunit C-terminal-like domain-containing protein [Candidatus Freyarchaeota archaeon]
MGEEDYKLLTTPEALPEGVDPEEYIIATYYTVMPSFLDGYTLAQVAALEQSTGTWTPVPKETPEVRKKHAARVVAAFEIPPYQWQVPKTDERHWILQIAFPIINLGEPNLPLLLSTVVGNISAGGKIKLLDLKFPKKWVQGFKGPKFGIQGLRKLLKIPERPILNNMIKPCVYSPPEIGAELAYEVAAGGVDFVKDDELLADMPLNRVEDRLVKFLEALDKASEEKGEPTLYTVNITDRPKKVLELADKAIDLGANALMVNIITVGYETFRELAEDPSINVPILAHTDYSAVHYAPEYYGVDARLILGKFCRLAGADIEVYPAPYGKAPMIKETYMQVWRELTFPFYHLKPTTPMPAGGIIVQNVPQITADIGFDFVVGVGGAMHAHPDGPRAGATAFRQAIDATMQGIPLEKYAEDHKELGRALGTWKSSKIL